MSLRRASPADDAFILGLVERFTGFELPAGRTRESIDAAIRGDVERHLRERPRHSAFFVIEDAGVPAGFIHLQLLDDALGCGRVCHVSDLAVAPGHEGRGLAGRLLAHADAFGREHGCERMTLSVFEGNERARALYERHGFVTDLLRMGKPLA